MGPWCCSVLGGDCVGQIFSLGEPLSGVDTVAFGPPLDERLPLGCRRIQWHRLPGVVRFGVVVGERHLHRHRHFAAPSIS
ncbi:hypothetical protein [Streptomyces anulatus]|uniref:hypothetical protein n=1 Tax=Streptomyces anulatus TaxID=1892 RepID=UPI003325DC4A